MIYKRESPYLLAVINFVSEENSQKLIDFNDKLRSNKQALMYVFLEHNTSNYSSDAEIFCLKNRIICITDVPSIVKKVKMENREVYTVDGRHNSKDLNEELSKHILLYLKKNNLI